MAQARQRAITLWRETHPGATHGPSGTFLENLSFYDSFGVLYFLGTDEERAAVATAWTQWSGYAERFNYLRGMDVWHKLLRVFPSAADDARPLAASELWVWAPLAIFVRASVPDFVGPHVDLNMILERGTAALDAFAQLDSDPEVSSRRQAMWQAAFGIGSSR